MINHHLLLKPYDCLIDKIIDFFTSQVTDPNMFSDIQKVCSNHPVLSQKLNHNAFLSAGFLGQDDFGVYAELKNWSKNKKGIPFVIVNIVLSLLSQNLILIKTPTGSINNSCDIYKANGNLVKNLYENNLIKNLLYGFDYIYERYQQSLFKIEVTKNKNVSLGTGFLYENPTGNCFIITNKHVVEQADKLKLINHDNQKFDVLDLDKDDVNDIAILKADSIFGNVGFLPNTQFNILDKIMTMGYPIIPTTRDAYLVCHSGEINSMVENYQGHELFIFSSRIAPGSSGSPIIDKSGRFVGLVSEALFEENAFKEKGIIPYSAGVPAQKVEDFIQKLESS